MQEVKYCYKGIPLAEYCKEKGININTIRTRIWKMRKSSKYSSFSDEEIIEKAISTYGSANKYFYQGMSLRKYCLDNGLNIGTIWSRIKKIKEEFEDISDSEAVRRAIEEFEDSNYKYFYHGMLLKEYCYSHPELNYSTLKSYLKRELEKGNDASVEEVIDRYISKEHKGIYKYYYCGIPLVRYCEENGISYKNIITYISRNRDSYGAMSDDLFIEMIINSYQPFEVKYKYRGVSLRTYCQEHDLSYYSIVSFVKRRLAKDTSLDIDDLIDEGIRTINRYGFIYYYKGVPLKDYCIEHGLNVSSIRGAIIRKKAKSNLPLQEIVDSCVEGYQKFSIKYYYEGESLYSFCLRSGLSYNTIIYRYLEDYSDSDISVDEAIKKIVDEFLVNPPRRIKYYFQDESLSSFCNSKGYSYSAIYQRIKHLENKDYFLDVESRINEAISGYEKRLEIKRINDIFLLLKDNLNDKDIQDICIKLNIDYDRVVELLDLDLNYRQAINLIWYFSDNLVSGKRSISDKKVMEVFSLVEKVKNEEYQDISLINLIGIFKSELYDSRNEIIIKYNRYIKKNIKSMAISYGVRLDKDRFEDIESELKLFIMMLLDKTYLNNEGMIVKYIDISTKGYLRNYIRNIKRDDGVSSLDDNKYRSDDSKMSKKKIDYITNKSDDIEDDSSVSFSSDMMRVLSELDHDDLVFIRLRFQEQYSDMELADAFHIDVSKVREREALILNQLRNSESIKVFKKTTNN